jgi:hypothetical protein
MSLSGASVIETSRLSRRITSPVEDPGALAVPRAGDSAVGIDSPVVTRHGERLRIDLVRHGGR